MPTVTDLKEQYRSLAIKAHEIVADDSRTATEIREALDPIEADIKNLSDQIADAEYLNDKRKQFGTPDAAPDVDEPPAARTVGSQIVDSDRFRQYAEQVKAGGGLRSSGPIEIRNATLTSGGITGTEVIAPQRQPGIMPILFERLTIADLMPNGTTNAPTVRYVKEITATNAASTVGEEGQKPEAALDWDNVDEPVRKIAVIFRVTDELLEDFEAFRSYLDGRGTLFVRLREEQQLLTGAGAGNDLDGILNRDGLTAAQALGADSIAVAVHKEITKVRVASFLDPDAIVFHPNDWEAARLEADGNDQFYGGGPFTGPYGNGGMAGPSYWGMRTVVTQAMTENTVLVGAFATAAQIFRRSGITVDMTNSDGDDFSYNRTAVRFEERLALAVYRPSAFGTVTGV